MNSHGDQESGNRPLSMPLLSEENTRPKITATMARAISFQMAVFSAPADTGWLPSTEGFEYTRLALREWLAELGHRKRVAVSMVGKVKTAFQMTAISLMLWKLPIGDYDVYRIGYGLLFAAAALTLWSMVVYLKAAWPVMRDEF